MFCDFGKEVVGLDIGGANLKAAIWLGENDVRGRSMNFPMWKQPEQLADGVRKIMGEIETSGTTGASALRRRHLAVTMTGELADCFASRREGVARIVDQLLQVVSADQLSIYSVDGRWFTAEQAKEDPWTVAASNWHALASWLAQWPPTAHALRCAVLVDIGSTTVDILPVINGRLATQARTDRDRLEQSQLVYTGVRRTPVCAVVQRLAVEGIDIPVMAELFATVDDAYLLLGLVEEDAQDADTADGRPRTKPDAAARLARMIGEDADRLSPLQLSCMANQIIGAQARQLAEAIEANLNQFSSEIAPHLVCSGHGLPLFEQTIRKLKTATASVIRLNEHASDEVSRCAPAAAVAWLRLLEMGSKGDWA